MSENTIVVIRIKGGCLTQVVGTNVTAVLIDEDNGTGPELFSVEDWEGLDADEIKESLELAELFAPGGALEWSPHVKKLIADAEATAYATDFNYQDDHPGWARLLSDLSKTE